jgi:hypothetical protein
VDDNDRRLAQIREHPGSAASRELLDQVMYEVIEDVDVMTSVDVPRLRALARLLSDVAPHQAGAERVNTKEAAAAADAVADFLTELSRIAARGFHVQ